MSVRHRLAPRFLTTLAVLLACSPDGSGMTEASTGSTSSTGTDGTSTDASTTVTPTTGGTSTGDETTGTSEASTTEASTTEASTTEAVTATTTEASTTEASTTEASTASTTGDETTTTATTDDSTTGTDTGTSTTEDSGSTTGDGEGLGPDAQAAIDALELVVDGVLWPSESDYPWLVFGLADAAPVTVANLKELVGPLVVVENGEAPLAEQAIEEEPWEERFLDMTTPQDWWTDYELMRAEQYEAIRATLDQHLDNLKTFRIGEQSGPWLSGAIDMFVIGETADGDLVGIQTISVET